MLTLMLVAAAQASAVPVAMPGWMSGVWVTGSEANWTEEWWSSDRAGLMLGGSRSGKGEALGFFEHMRIARTKAGVEFCALPQGQSGGCFSAIAVTERSITFENRAHNYPQRIRYWRDGRELKAEISLADGSRKQSWTYQPASR